MLEEPPSYGVFLLITDNPEKLLPTIRSRCIQLGLTALPEETLLSALRQQFPDKDAQTRSAAAARSGGGGNDHGDQTRTNSHVCHG